MLELTQDANTMRFVGQLPFLYHLWNNKPVSIGKSLDFFPTVPLLMIFNRLGEMIPSRNDQPSCRLPEMFHSIAASNPELEPTRSCPSSSWVEKFAGFVSFEALSTFWCCHLRCSYASDGTYINKDWSSLEHLFPGYLLPGESSDILSRLVLQPFPHRIERNYQAQWPALR
jgi:hypothetical protein